MEPPVSEPLIRSATSWLDFRAHNTPSGRQQSLARFCERYLPDVVVRNIDYLRRAVEACALHRENDAQYQAQFVDRLLVERAPSVDRGTLEFLVTGNLKRRGLSRETLESIERVANTYQEQERDRAARMRRQREPQAASAVPSEIRAEPARDSEPSVGEEALYGLALDAVARAIDHDGFRALRLDVLQHDALIAILRRRAACLVEEAQAGRPQLPVSELGPLVKRLDAQLRLPTGDEEIGSLVQRHAYHRETVVRAIEAFIAACQPLVDADDADDASAIASLDVGDAMYQAILSQLDAAAGSTV